MKLLRSCLSSWLLRWRADTLSARVADLEHALELERAKNRVLQAELDGLAAVVARDRIRVQAETSEYARKVASAGG